MVTLSVHGHVSPSHAVRSASGHQDKQFLIELCEVRFVPPSTGQLLHMRLNDHSFRACYPVPLRTFSQAAANDPLHTQHSMDACPVLRVELESTVALRIPCGTTC